MVRTARSGIRSGCAEAAGAWHRQPMEDTADAPTDEGAWRSRLDENRATMDGLRQDIGRVSAAIAETEQGVARALRGLAAQDRLRGRTAAAERREARAEDAERFAARESAAADVLIDRGRPDVDRR